MTLKTAVRTETDADAGVIAEVTAAAFAALELSNHTEPFIIAALRAAGALTVSATGAVLHVYERTGGLKYGEGGRPGDRGHRLRHRTRVTHRRRPIPCQARK